VAMKENAVITFEKDYSSHYEGYDPNSAESFIIFSLMQNTYLEQSLDFAGIIQNNFEKSAQRTNKGVKQAGFLVLWKTTMPAVLIETGFVSNPEEEKFLSSEEGQMKLAQSIYKSFTEYKAHIESNSNFSNQRHSVSEEPVKNETTETTDTTPVIESNNSAVTYDENVTFRVQIAASPKPISLKSKTFKKCKTIKGFKKVEEVSGGNTYKYTIGNTSNYKEILEINKNVKKVYPKAFVIALKNGKIVPLNDVLKR
jgi:N-acetylmuramoyl-L-alanine amidase